MGGLAQDVRHAVRSLRDTPTMMLGALTCVALGIAATSAMPRIRHGAPTLPLRAAIQTELATWVEAKSGSPLTEGAPST